MLDGYFNGVSMPEYVPEIDAELVQDTERIIAASLLLGRLHASGSINAADGDIPPVAFEDAAQFIKAKIPVTKTEWNGIEPKMRFRAFTVAALAECDYIETAKGLIADAIKTGKGYAETWEQIKAAFGDDAMKLRPGYWENVYRTNSQTAYNAGKVMEFEKTHPEAIRLFVVDDSRTSHICRGLLRASGEGYVLPANHKFWSEYGYPPYHYQCRTGIAAVHKSQLADFPPDNPGMAALRRDFKPMEGFGGNPVAKESWWKLTDGMVKRAKQYGLFPEIVQQAYSLDMISYSQELLKGFTRIYTGKNGGFVEQMKSSHFEKKEIDAAKTLADFGHEIYLLPRSEKYKVKSPDMLIDGRIGELKNLTTMSIETIKTEIKKAGTKQRARVLDIYIADAVEKGVIVDAFASEIKRTPIEKVFLHWNNHLYELNRKSLMEKSW